MRVSVPLALALLGGCWVTDEEIAEAVDVAEGAAPIDLVLIVDNSPSMQEHAEELALALDGIVAALGADGRDWQVGVTTTSVDYTNGTSSTIEPGEAGLLVGAPVSATDPEAVALLQEQVLCGAVCWDVNDLPSNPAHVCGDALTDVTVEVLDCACGVDAWREHCGVGTEEGLEAATMAACRSIASPGDACFGYTSPEGGEQGTVLMTGDAGSNGALIREGATTAFVVVTDEGDGSRRVANGDNDPTVYVDAWAGLGLDAVFHAFGPAWDGSDGDCLDGALAYSVERYQEAAAATGGVYGAMTDLAAGCAPEAVLPFFEGVVAGTP